MREGLCRRTLCLLVVSLVILSLRPAVAQQPAPSTAPAGTAKPAVTNAVADEAAAEAAAAAELAKVKNYVRIVTAEYERAQGRVNALTEQLKALDDDIESRVDRIVSLLSSVRDSTDTASSRLRQEKEDVLEGLKATARYYAMERDKRRREMDNPYAQISSDELARNVDVLNDRIEKRVEQSIQVAASMMTHTETWEGKYQDGDVNYSRHTREYSKGERDAKASAQIKGGLADDLGKSIEKLQRDVQKREAELRTTTDPVKQKRLTNEIKALRETIESRRSQVQKLATQAAPSRGVGVKGAYEIDQMIDEMAEDLKRDFAKFKSLVRERDAAVARVKPLKARLEKGTTILKRMEYGPDADPESTPGSGSTNDVGAAKSEG